MTPHWDGSTRVAAKPNEKLQTPEIVQAKLQMWILLRLEGILLQDYHKTPSVTVNLTGFVHNLEV